ncbi:probable xyloglucan endotransglucosylase/hydrolase protein 28 [Phragmites australis]|uniref:probable xyloglucan endotransglucosylase/hydrolase protein 28 n=1 Tax=Phragmites australis TaxID=29695 RepID=UPI002D773B4E|nr:probable xyloglucan endotransglucosylase/hydrolase protein 28 [Phragmites australis]
MAHPFFRLPLLLLLLVASPRVSGQGEEETALAVAARLLPRLAASFGDGYMQLFGGSNLALHGGGGQVRIALDERTGAGFASRGAYLYGFFSASIKLPADYTAGVVVAFYMSNGDVYEKTHDELDFEFLGNIRGREWRVQTNVYGNGSTSVGREERYRLWFDPTEDFHRYAILWSHDRIVFYIDETPIREVVRTESMGAQFPSKPMSLYATIWDGSSWATSGGRYKVDYKYAPFVAELADLTLHGCAVDSLTCTPDNVSVHTTVAMSGRQRSAMKRFRTKYMTYSYCYDRLRYSRPQPECDVGPEAELFLPTGEATFMDRHGRGKRHRRGSVDSAL